MNMFLELNKASKKIIFFFCMFLNLSVASDLTVLNTNQKNMALKNTLLSKTQIDSLTAKLDVSGQFIDLNYAYTGYGNGGQLNPHLTRLALLARHYTDSSAYYFHNSNLKNKIYLGIDKWITLNLKDGNWWYRVISWPQAFIPSLILMKDTLRVNNPALFTKAYNYMIYSSTYPGMSGANATDVAQVTLATASFKDSLLLAQKVMADVSDEFNVKSGVSEGFYSDYSFNQHNGGGRQLYYGGYGAVFYTGFYNLQSAVKGTSFEFSDAIKNNMIQLMLEGFGKTVYNNYADIFTFGRGFGRSGEPKSSVHIGAINNLLSLSIGNTSQKSQLQKLLNRIKNGSSDSNFASYNKVFPHADFMSHQRPNWYTSVRGVSTRTVGNESGNGEGLLNFHMGDGANLVLHTGNEYGQIYPTWNWRRIPGTTIEQRSGALPLVDWGAGGQGQSSFAGGVSDGTFGAYAFVFDRASQDSNVTAKKAWFFFDKEYVALGAGIQAPNASNDVYTSVNQSLFADSTLSWGQGSPTGVLSYAQTKYFSKPFWAHHNQIGYQILDFSGSSTLTSSDQSGRWSSLYSSKDTSLVTNQVFSLWINHGKNVVNGRYAYAVVPGISADSMKVYSSQNPIVILKNSDTLQAVYHKTLKRAAFIFYKPGQIKLPDSSLIQVNLPLELFIHFDSDSLSLFAATPEYKAQSVKITLDKHWTGSGITYDSIKNQSTVNLSLAAGDSVGQTQKRVLHLFKTTSECVPIKSSGDDGNIVQNLFDQNLNTRWSSQGVGQWVEICLNQPKMVQSFDMAFYAGNTRKSQFILLGSIDGVQYDTLLNQKQSSGLTLNKEHFTLPSPKMSKFFRWVGLGNTSNDWNSWTELSLDTLVVNSPKIPKPVIELYKIQNKTLIFSNEVKWVQLYTADGQILYEAEAKPLEISKWFGQVLYLKIKTEQNVYFKKIS